MKDTYFVSR